MVGRCRKGDPAIAACGPHDFGKPQEIFMKKLLATAIAALCVPAVAQAQDALGTTTTATTQDATMGTTQDTTGAGTAQDATVGGTMQDTTGATGTMSTQDTTGGTMSTTTGAGQDTMAATDATAPDGTPAFGFEPYVGVFGGYHDFDRGSKPFQVNGSANGWLVGGYAGVNIPLGGFVVGAEGNIAKGFQDIDYEYGATGHIGARVGDSGMFFARAGYHWIEGRRGFDDDRGVTYGFGVEAGPADIGLGGITGESGVRLRLAIDTFDEFQSIRPMAGLTFHF
jgi:hypothetical protein